MQKNIDLHSCMHCKNLRADIKSDIPFDCTEPHALKGTPINERNDCKYFINGNK